MQTTVFIDAVGRRVGDTLLTPKTQREFWVSQHLKSRERKINNEKEGERENKKQQKEKIRKRENSDDHENMIQTKREGVYQA